MCEAAATSWSERRTAWAGPSVVGAVASKAVITGRCPQIHWRATLRAIVGKGDGKSVGPMGFGLDGDLGARKNEFDALGGRGQQSIWEI